MRVVHTGLFRGFHLCTGANCLKPGVHQVILGALDQEGKSHLSEAAQATANIDVPVLASDLPLVKGSSQPGALSSLGEHMACSPRSRKGCGVPSSYTGVPSTMAPKWA